MGRKKNIQISKKSNGFIDSALVNDATYFDYLARLKKICLSMFEWVNLPDSMDARYLEKSLYYHGKGALLKDDKYGFINTNCASSGYINIYGTPTKLNCYSYEYQSTRSVYSGLTPFSKDTNECILVRNDWDSIPTCSTIELFALRLYEAERTCDVNVKAQKTPVILLCDDDQRLTYENLLQKYEGNTFAIIGDKNQISLDGMKVLKTDAPFVADKVMNYKKQIWNEALTFLGINNMEVDKKERMITDEANQNNELINLNLQSYLAPRKQACKEFNEKYGLTGTDKEINVRIRSDLHNIIKNAESIITDYTDNIIDEDIKDDIGGVVNE